MITQLMTEQSFFEVCGTYQARANGSNVHAVNNLLGEMQYYALFEADQVEYDKRLQALSSLLWDDSLRSALNKLPPKYRTAYNNSLSM